MAGAKPDPEALEHAFRWEVLKMLKTEDKITDLVIENMLSWYNSGFNVYCGDAISVMDALGLGNTLHATGRVRDFHPLDCARARAHI
jgi:hypothetical protein